MACSNNENPPYFLKLKQVASWQVKGICEDNHSNIVARVPSLQRGAVWEPQQIEMLWDSIMRGFPIGTIVLAEKIKGQNNQSPPMRKCERSASEGEYSHHILDGQQRCNAIAWGFVDPWEDGLSDDVVLWLDLKPGNRVKQNTTRKYLFRVTTKAHPWGFYHNDQAGNLSTSDIKKFKDKLINLNLNLENWPEKFHADLISNKDNVKRPSPRLALPYDAVFPVPVFLLFTYFKEGKLDWETLAYDQWMKVINAWSGLNIQQLENSDRKYIEAGLAIADQTYMVAQQVPDLLRGIDDIEQIFQRLNRQGTRLDNEELAYSLIKAYWPEVEKKLGNFPDQFLHTTEARLIGLAIRVARTERVSQKLEPELSVERVRNIFQIKEGIIKDDKDVIAEGLIREFIENGDLERSLTWIDQQFLYDKQVRDYGIPKYLRSSMAWHSRDVFAWLMLLAKRYEYRQIEDHVFLKKILGLALTIHWFGIDKSKAVDTLVSRHNDLEDITISDMNADENRPTVYVPLSPVEIEAALQLGKNSKEEQLVKWTNFWDGVVNYDTDGEEFQKKIATDRANKYGNFIGKLRSERELLVYVQRAYIENVFEGFDPSNKLMWKGHNRPWDYDHILPSQSLNAQARGRRKYLGIAKAWQESIGNLVAVDYSFNRSAQNVVDAYEKYAKSNDINVFSDILHAFVINLDSTDEIEPTKKFVLAAKDRLLAIYGDWFENLEIQKYRKKNWSDNLLDETRSALTGGFIGVDDFLHMKNINGSYGQIPLDDLIDGKFLIQDKNIKAEYHYTSAEELISGGWAID